MPLNDYINLQLALNETKIWSDNFNSLYTFKGSKGSLASLLKTLQVLKFHLPSAGVLEHIRKAGY